MFLALSEGGGRGQIGCGLCCKVGGLCGPLIGMEGWSGTRP